MSVNQLTFQEGSEIVIDAEVETFDAGWTPSYVSVIRTGPAVQLHVEASFASAAAATVCKFPAEYAPAQTLTNGEFTLGADGTLSYTGSTAAVSLGTLSAALATGAAITSLPTSALSAPVAAGDSITVTSGADSQTFTASAAAAAGATAIPVDSATPNFAYPIGSTVQKTDGGSAVAQFVYAAANPAP